MKTREFFDKKRWHKEHVRLTWAISSRSAGTGSALGLYQYSLFSLSDNHERNLRHIGTVCLGVSLSCALRDCQKFPLHGGEACSRLGLSSAEH